MAHQEVDFPLSKNFRSEARTWNTIDSRTCKCRFRYSMWAQTSSVRRIVSKYLRIFRALGSAREGELVQVAESVQSTQEEAFLA